ncbi:MAG: hypothetical protein ACR2G6_00470 [Gemmatimonadaceae bacterium]
MSPCAASRLAVASGVFALALSACGSPESARVRGGGSGADIGNRNPVVEMHAGSKMYFETPCLMPDDECTGPSPASGLAGDFPEPKRKKK